MPVATLHRRGVGGGGRGDCGDVGGNVTEVRASAEMVVECRRLRNGCDGVAQQLPFHALSSAVRDRMRGDDVARFDDGGGAECEGGGGVEVKAEVEVSQAGSERSQRWRLKSGNPHGTD